MGGGHENVDHLGPYWEDRGPRKGVCHWGHCMLHTPYRIGGPTGGNKACMPILPIVIHDLLVVRSATLGHGQKT